MCSVSSFAILIRFTMEAVDVEFVKAMFKEQKTYAEISELLF